MQLQIRAWPRLFEEQVRFLANLCRGVEEAYIIENSCNAPKQRILVIKYLSKLDDTPHRRRNKHLTHYYNKMLNMLNHLFYHFCIHFIQNSPYLNPLKLRIKNKAVKLIALCHRRIPFHQRNNVQAQIKRLVDADIIKKG